MAYYLSRAATSSSQSRMSIHEDVAKASEVDHESIAAGVTCKEDVDDAVLRANGHKSELKRQFNWLSALGLGFSITNSWAGYIVCMLQLWLSGNAANT